MATYCTRIYVNVDSKALMEKLCAMDVSDLGKGFYKAEDIFRSSSTESNFYDSESAINENDLEVLVARAIAVINGHGTILADTFSYDYDPLPQVCYYNGGEFISKLLDVDGGEFCETVEISDIDEWIRAVEDADEYDEDFEEDWDDEEDEENEESDSWNAQPMGMDEETLRDIFGIDTDEHGFAFQDDGSGCVTLHNYFGKESVISIPEGINDLAAGCFAGNEIVEEVTVPKTVETMDMCCFANCPNLRRVYVPASVESFGCDNSTFRGCPSLTIYAPIGSAAETYAKKNNIPFIAE